MLTQLLPLPDPASHFCPWLILQRQSLEDLLPKDSGRHLQHEGHIERICNEYIMIYNEGTKTLFQNRCQKSDKIFIIISNIFLEKKESLFLPGEAKA